MVRRYSVSQISLTFSLLLLTNLWADKAIPKILPLWPDGIPGEWQAAKPEEMLKRDDGLLRIKNVNEPTLEYFSPRQVHPVLGRGAMIVCPGGGYQILAFDHEGRHVADWLAGLGMHVFVLKYRLPRAGRDNPRWLVPWADACRALELVRKELKQAGSGVQQVGMMGFSAGGHLTVVTSTAGGESKFADKAAPRPDFAALIYPAYLVGDEKASTLVEEARPDQNSPPTFLVHTAADHITALSSLFFFRAMKDLNLPAEMHVFAKGEHGYGIRKSKDRVSMWPKLMESWLADVLSESPKSEK